MKKKTTKLDDCKRIIIFYFVCLVFYSEIHRKFSVIAAEGEVKREDRGKRRKELSVSGNINYAWITIACR